MHWDDIAGLEEAKRVLEEVRLTLPLTPTLTLTLTLAAATLVLEEVRRYSCYTG